MELFVATPLIPLPSKITTTFIQSFTMADTQPEKKFDWAEDGQGKRLSIGPQILDGLSQRLVKVAWLHSW